MARIILIKHCTLCNYSYLNTQDNVWCGKLQRQLIDKIPEGLKIEIPNDCPLEKSEDFR